MYREAQFNNENTYIKGPWQLENVTVENKHVFPMRTGWHSNPSTSKGSDTKSVSVSRGVSKTHTTNFGITTKLSDILTGTFGGTKATAETHTKTETTTISVDPGKRACLEYDFGKADLVFHYKQEVKNAYGKRETWREKTVEPVEYYIDNTRKIEERL